MDFAASGISHTLRSGNTDEPECVFEGYHRGLDKPDALVGKFRIVGVVDLGGVIVAVEDLDERNDILGHLVRLAVERVRGDFFRRSEEHTSELQSRI